MNYRLFSDTWLTFPAVKEKFNLAEKVSLFRVFETLGEKNVKAAKETEKLDGPIYSYLRLKPRKSSNPEDLS